jgi:hypothetical protein
MASKLVISDKQKLLRLMSDSELSNIRLLEFLHYTYDDIRREQLRRNIFSSYDSVDQLNAFIKEQNEKYKQIEAKIVEVSEQLKSCFIEQSQLKEMIDIAKSVLSKRTEYDTDYDEDDEDSDDSEDSEPPLSPPRTPRSYLEEAPELVRQAPEPAHQAPEPSHQAPEPSHQELFHQESFSELLSTLSGSKHVSRLSGRISDMPGPVTLPLPDYISLDSLRKRKPEEHTSSQKRHNHYSPAKSHNYIIAKVLSQNLDELADGRLYFTPRVVERAPYTLEYDVCTNDYKICQCGKRHSNVSKIYKGQIIHYSVCGHERPWIIKTNGQPARCTDHACNRIHLKA